MIKFGLVCISEMLRVDNPNAAFKTMTRTQFLRQTRSKSITDLSSRILHNLKVTRLTIAHCAQNKIGHYRLSCKLFPLITDPTLSLNVSDLPDYESIIANLNFIGQESKKLGISISIHPDQFVVLGSNSDDVCKKSIAELNFHAWVMDQINLPKSYESPINIHLNFSKFNNVHDFIKKVVQNFFLCDYGVQSRLVFENEDHGFWNCDNLKKYLFDYSFKEFGAKFPLTLDNLHDKCNNSKDKSYKDNFISFYETWPVTPVFHWSEGINNTSSHADYLSEPPPDYGLDCIFECEVKKKDIGFIKYVL